MTIDEIRELRRLISTPPWSGVIVRETPKRLDIVSGPIITSEAARAVQAATAGKPKTSPIEEFVSRAHKHVFHIHEVNPAWFEQNDNMVNDGKFLVKTPEMIDFLLAEVERLNQLLCQCGAV